MRRIVGVSQADENIDETNENLLMVTSSNSSRRSRGESSSSTASSSRRGGHGRGLHSKATIRARTPSSDENKMKKKGCCSKQSIATQSTMDDVLPHTVEREPVIVDEEGKIEIEKEDASGEEVKILEHENKEEPVLIDTDGEETKDEGEVGIVEVMEDGDDDLHSVSTASFSSKSNKSSTTKAESVGEEEEDKKDEIVIDVGNDDESDEAGGSDDDDDGSDGTDGEDDIESGRRRGRRRRKSAWAEVLDDDNSTYNSSSGSLSSKSSSKKKKNKDERQELKRKEKKKKDLKTSLTSTNEEGNERQPLLSKNNEQEKEKDEEEGKKSSSGRFPKTCKTIGAFSALTMTAAVCFVGYQVYPVVSDDLSLGNIAQHLKSYLLVDLPNGNLKPVLPDESDLLPIDSDGNFILPGGKNQTASSSTLPSVSTKNTKDASSSSKSSSLESSEDAEADEDTNPDILREADIGKDEDEEQIETKSAFGGFLKSKAKQDQQTAFSTSNEASDNSDVGKEEDTKEKEQEGEIYEEHEEEEKDRAEERKESKELREQQDDSSSNYSGKELEKGSISSGYARSKERYAEAVKNFKSGKMSTSGKMYDLGPSETPQDFDGEEEKVDDEEDKPVTKSSIVPKVEAVAKIVDKTKDVVSSALETIDHLENGSDGAVEGEKEDKNKREAPVVEEEETRANSDDMPSLEEISTTSAQKRLNEDKSNASKANAEASNVVAVADNSTDIAMEKPAAETGTTPELTRTTAETPASLSSPKILVSKACETSEDETTLGLYRQVNSQCESTEDGSKPIGCIPKTKNCQGCYLSDTPAASQKDSLTQCSSVVCEFHDVHGCKA